MKFTAFFILLLSVTWGCSHRPSQEGAIQWIDQGDPSTLIENANGQSAVSRSQIEELTGWLPYRRYEFLKKNRAQELNEMLRQQRPNKRKMILVEAMSIQVESDSVLWLQEQNHLKIRFQQIEKDSFRLTHFNGKSARLLHYSRHQNVQVASLLVQTQDQNLHVVYFAPLNVLGDYANEAPQSSRFSYMLPGGGRWRESTLRISLCGFPNQETLRHAEEAVAQWQKVLVGRLRLEVQNRSGRCLPFSDLNQHGIYWNNEYRPNPVIKEMNLGQTFLVDGFGGGRVLDGDVFIFASELLKQASGDDGFDQSIRRERLRATFVHEIGHLLALHHPQDSSIPSVMNYQDRVELQPYDIEAVHSLYQKNH